MARTPKGNSMRSMNHNGKYPLFRVETSGNDQGHHGLAGQARGQTWNKLVFFNLFDIDA